MNKYTQHTAKQLESLVYECMAAQRNGTPINNIINRYALLLTPQPGEIIVPLSVYDDVLKSKPKESLNPISFHSQTGWIVEWKPQNAFKAFLKTILKSKATKRVLIVVGAIILAVGAIQIVF